MTTETLTEPTTIPETTRERTTSDVLLAAARYIEEHGWSQEGTWIEADGSACMVGGIKAVTNYYGDAPEIGLFDAAEIRLVSYLNVNTAERWNDTPGRTEAEVIAALREAAR